MLHTIVDSIRCDLNDYRGKRFTRRSRYRAQLEDLPPGLYEYWAATAPQEFEGIPRDAFFFVRAVDSLIEFFDCVAFSGQPCALPSKAADSVWHAWLRYAPRTHHDWCLKHFKRLIPHLEAADMPGPMDAALATCLVSARRLAGLAPYGPQLPPLFLADRLLGMPGGHAYQVCAGRVAVASMDARGRAGYDWRFPTQFMAGALVHAGLVHGWEYQEYQAQQARQAGAHAGNGCGSSLGGCDSGAGGDGNDSGGCGSSCGGCGGGD